MNSRFGGRFRQFPHQMTLQFRIGANFAVLGLRVFALNVLML